MDNIQLYVHFDWTKRQRIILFPFCNCQDSEGSHAESFLKQEFILSNHVKRHTLSTAVSELKSNTFKAYFIKQNKIFDRHGIASEPDVSYSVYMPSYYLVSQTSNRVMTV